MASFSKALSAAALSAVLVGCVGGGSDETIKTTEEPKPIPKQNDAVVASLKLDIVKDKLSKTKPTAEQVKDVEIAIKELDDIIKNLPPSNEKDKYQEQIKEAQAAVNTANKVYYSGQSEADKKKAEADKKKAEAARKKAEEEEAARKKAEADKKKAEADKKKAEADKKKAEADKKKEEAARKKAEADKKKEEAARKKAEADKKKAEDDAAAERAAAAAKRRKELAAPTYSAIEKVITTPVTVTQTNNDIKIAGIATFKENISGTGWQYKKYSLPDGAVGTLNTSTSKNVDLHMYSYVGQPEAGKKFAHISGTSSSDYQYALNGATAISSESNRYIEFGTPDPKVSLQPKYVSAPLFTTRIKTAGKNVEFSLDDTRPSKTTVGVTVPIFKTRGSYHGVSGSYECTGTCKVTAQVAGNGYTFSSGTWVFDPDDPEKRVINPPDNVYASYGWWIQTDTLSPQSIGAFTTNKGDPWVNAKSSASGSATYNGKAAGQFAVIGGTDLTVEAGSFTATAELNADFINDKLSGTISNFRGPRNGSSWVVTLPISPIGETGVSSNSTIWSVDGRTFQNNTDTQGGWTAKFADEDYQGTPKVVVGTFDAEYDSPKARIVGGFGATTND